MSESAWFEVREKFGTISAEEIYDRLIERAIELTGAPDSAAQALSISKDTVLRRMGKISLKQRRNEKLGRLANSQTHPTGAGADVSDPPPLGGQRKL